MYGLLTSQVGEQNHSFEVPGVSNITLKGFIKEAFGYEYGFLPVVAAAHIVWILLFFFIFVCGIKYLNFQQRWSSGLVSIEISSTFVEIKEGSLFDRI